MKKIEISISLKAKLGKLRDWLNIILAISACVFFCFVAYRFVNFLKENPSKIQLSYNADESFSDDLLNSLQSFEYYSQRFNSKDMFLISQELLTANKESSPGAEKALQIEQNLQAMVKSLTLVGILLDQKPIAVIENTQTNETMFVSQGDHIEDLSIKEIRDKKVVLEYKDQLIELVQ